MQQRQCRERLRVAQRPTARQQVRHADRKHLLLEQQPLGRRRARGGRRLPGDLDVDVGRAGLQFAFHDRELDLHAGMGRGEFRQTPHQPVVGKRRADADAQTGRQGHRATARAQIREAVEQVGQAGGQRRTGRRRTETRRRSVEQRRADKRFQPAQAMADRALGHAELGRRPRHAAMAQRGVEGDEGVERREGAHFLLYERYSCRSECLALGPAPARRHHSAP